MTHTRLLAVAVLLAAGLAGCAPPEPPAPSPTPVASPTDAAVPDVTSRPAPDRAPTATPPAGPTPSATVVAAVAPAVPPPTPAPSPTATLPADPVERARAILARAEAARDAGQHRAALDALDAGPTPPEAADLVALRRADLAARLGDHERARVEVARSELRSSQNRLLLLGAAEIAERLDEHALAGELWARAGAQPAWWADRLDAVQAAAVAYARAGALDRAVEQATIVLEMGGDPAEAVALLVERVGPPLDRGGVLTRIQAQRTRARATLQRYLAGAGDGPFAASAARPRGLSVEADLGWAAAREADAAGVYRAWWGAHPADPRAPEARFREGLVHYRDGAFEAAVEVWAAEAVPAAAPEDRTRALYWWGKALIQLNDRDGADRRWRMAAAVRPTGYYAVRATDRLAGAFEWPGGGPTLPPAAPSAAERAEVDRWLAGWTTAAPPSADESRARGRAGLFAGLGLERTAGAELDGLVERAPSPWTVYRVGERAAELGLWPSAVRAGLRLGRMAPERSSLDTPRAVRRLVYPAGYRELVTAATSRYGVGPLLIAALIRQESQFDRHARSAAGARGLTQVMPATGADIARRTGYGGFSPEHLEDAGVGIDFGARFLAGQIVGFEGDVFRAVAAYNAGPVPASRWAAGTDDPDVFVESIEYAETRAYVKAVYLHHAAYRGLLTPASP
ncbi:MAG TPA: transglycosylase SLT domain-containing protein [Chloroflexota bacterium]|nr:transglycosylase SLT domain-containing protein [Chloroflexota bacterium]